MRLDIGRRLGLLGVVTVAVAVAVLPSAGAAEGRPLTRWLGSWAASPLPPDLGGQSVTGFNDQTLREVVYLHFGGGRVRVRVTNAFGASPLALGRATVALRAPGASIVPGSARVLTFDGGTSPTVPAAPRSSATRRTSVCRLDRSWRSASSSRPRPGRRPSTASP